MLQQQRDGKSRGKLKIKKEKKKKILIKTMITIQEQFKTKLQSKITIMGLNAAESAGLVNSIQQNNAYYQVKMLSVYLY